MHKRAVHDRIGSAVRLAVYGSTALMTLGALPAGAGPTGSTVVRSPGTFSNPSPTTTVVPQSSGGLPAGAKPTGGTVVSGQATINNPNSTTTVIDQSSNATQIDWSTFNIGKNATVDFVQPSSSAVALNVIFDQSP